MLLSKFAGVECVCMCVCGVCGVYVACMCGVCGVYVACMCGVCGVCMCGICGVCMCGGMWSVYVWGYVECVCVECV